MNDAEKFMMSAEGEPYPDYFRDNVKVTDIKRQTSEISFDWTYAMMHIVAQRILLDQIQQNTSGRMLLDVGSQFSFVSFASSFFDVTSLEVRFKNFALNIENLCSIRFIEGEAQSLPCESCMFDVVTSFHAIEHFGLGRYGDRIDYFGDQKGIKEFARVLKDDGVCIVGVPAGVTSHIVYNGQRVYNPLDFDSIFQNFGLTKQGNGVVVYSPGSRADNIVIGQIDTLASYNPGYTPPVYMSVYKKSGN